jgi:hypothetical protein
VRGMVTGLKHAAGNLLQAYQRGADIHLPALTAVGQLGGERNAGVA